MLYLQYHGDNSGTTRYHGHTADCQLAPMNVVEVHVSVVGMDEKKYQ